MRDNPEVRVDEFRRFAFLREETRFEIELLHGRINALISAQAFLTIAFTMAESNSNARWGTTFTAIVPPILSSVGLLLAALAWPGVDASFKIIIEWTARQRSFVRENPDVIDLMWRLDVPGKGNLRADPDTRDTMFFARAVPPVFGLAWALLTVIALILPWRR